MYYFFEMDVNVIVWLVRYVIIYYVVNLYENYKVGYGIILLQVKEVKYSGIINDLDLINRFNVVFDKGKWWQVMRVNYVRVFVLFEYQLMLNFYIFYYKFRFFFYINLEMFCNCGRVKEMSDYICMV